VNYVARTSQLQLFTHEFGGKLWLSISRPSAALNTRTSTSAFFRVQESIAPSGKKVGCLQSVIGRIPDCRNSWTFSGHNEKTTKLGRRNYLILLEAAIGIEPMNEGFAEMAVNFL